MRIFILLMLLVACETASAISWESCYGIYRERIPKDCEELYDLSNNACPDYTYWIAPDGDVLNQALVNCDMEGGGWTVILKRRPDLSNNSVSFTLQPIKSMLWFNLFHNFMGLIPLHRLTSSGRYWLMAELWAQGEKRVAIYEGFSVAGQNTSFRLITGTFRRDKSNVTGDALLRSNGVQFSTFRYGTLGDDCARYMQGPGWFDNCTDCSYYGAHSYCPDWNPFGPYNYTSGTPDMGRSSIWWNYFNSDGAHSLDGLVLKVRRTAP